MNAEVDRFLLAEATWNEAKERTGPSTVAILPVGATEAHGPHLPLSTDTIISNEMARRAAEKLQRFWGATVFILPPLTYAVVTCAADFPGSLGVSSQTLLATIREIAAGLERHGVTKLCLANSHFDPEHLQVLRKATETILKPHVVCPDFTRRKLAARLTEEFQSGSCHAGRFETSLILVARARLVRRELALRLPNHPVNLPEKLKSGASTFQEAGMDQGYCGAPAEATAREGERTFEILSDILVEACVEDEPPR